MARALKKVYASLWNERAFEEREYWGMNHRAAFMGVAVNPSFVLRAAGRRGGDQPAGGRGRSALPGGLAARRPAGGAAARSRRWWPRPSPSGAAPTASSATSA